MSAQAARGDSYRRIIEWVFRQNYRPGDISVSFRREELVDASDALGIERKRNLGDIPYMFRFRQELPESIQATAPEDTEWIIVGVGRGAYQFRLAAPGKIQVNRHYLPVKVPEATPEIVRYYAPGTDEQALLTRVRYNRLVDLFTGLTCYSVQNHLRTTVKTIGQIEIDEIYVGINRRGTHFVLPCQAKSPGDKFGIAQVMQDTLFCHSRFPNAICKSIGLQFTGDSDVALLELAVHEENNIFRFRIVEEKHYQLVPRSLLDEEELASLKRNEI